MVDGEVLVRVVVAALDKGTEQERTRLSEGESAVGSSVEGGGAELAFSRSTLNGCRGGGPPGGRWYDPRFITRVEGKSREAKEVSFVFGRYLSLGI